ncbi:hypothetical protein ASC64_10985 [Nocardioides sp. Root122]|uniref:hypothetical protein n=1 Tax=Nocardioides TaxID=1839 RepID=UPI0007026522|nr:MULTISPECIES: hypothetical protein [Nocardioides]KQV67738.1 hypothetical protein ASC64_10985 [Nocardioides sp. Root122]MCK9823611.1 hypothetical protein [Nocardioides cavernae]
MTPARVTRFATLSLGVLYVAAGAAEIVRAATSTGDGGVILPGTLVAGGALVLTGLALTPPQPHVGRGLVCVGSLLGILATAGTVVVPVLAVAVVVLTLRETVSA